MARVAFLAERMRTGFGVDLVVDNLAHGLANRGHDVSVFCMYADDTYGGRGYALKTVPIPQDRWAIRTDRNARDVARGLGFWAGEFDIFCIHTPPFFSLIPYLGCATIAVDHGVSPRTGRPLRERVDYFGVEWIQQHRYFTKATSLVTISTFLADQLPKELANRAVVIGHGADHYPEASDQDSRKVRKELKIADDEIMALYVGRLAPEPQPYKGVGALVEAFTDRRLGPATKLVMAGYGTADDVAALRQAGVVTWPNVPPEDMAGLFRAADIFVSASRWEGFDLPALEAQRAGRPVVLLDAGAHREVVKDGETGVLAADDDGLAAAVRSLAGDPDRRARMGQAAHAWATTFRWEHAVNRYDDLIQEVTPHNAVRSTVAPSIGTRPNTRELVTAVVLNYGSSSDDLDLCIGSLINSRCADLTEVILADNGSIANVEAPAEVVARWDRSDRGGITVRLLPFATNLGFAAGINRLVEASTNPWVFLLNSDADVHPDAVEHCAAGLEAADANCLSVAPKMLLRHHPGFFDAVGNAITPTCDAFNLGIGQPDVGQFDRPERCFGPCFGAGLFRKAAFAPSQVGPLDESFFMYYEDVDWNWRAQLYGYTSMTVPKAEVYHEHSGSTSLLHDRFKYRFINRNFLLAVSKNPEKQMMRRLLRHRLRYHLRNIAKGSSVRTTAQLLAEFGQRAPKAFADRRQVQARRVCTDAQVTRFAAGEAVFFDPETRSPTYDLPSLAGAYRRKFALTGDAKAEQILRAVELAATMMGRFGPEFLVDRLGPLLAEEPASARLILDRVVAGLS